MFVDDRRADIQVDRACDDVSDTASTLSGTTLRTANHVGGLKDAAASKLTRAQRIVKKFVQTMVKGRALSMLSKNGGSVEVWVSLNRELTTMSLQRAAKKDSKPRKVELKDIEQIIVGQEQKDEVAVESDDYCVNLVMQEAVVAFRFDDIGERDEFALCLGIFVDGNRKH